MRKGVLLTVTTLLVVAYSLWTVLVSENTYIHNADNTRIESKSQVLAAFTYNQGLPDINAIFDLVNKTRIESGQQPLIRDTRLADIAQHRAADMQTNNYYAHKGSDGRYFNELAKASGYKMSYGCENLDLQFSLMPEIYVQDWLKSNAGHRECLLNSKTTRAGYAAVRYGTPNQRPSDAPTYIVVAIHAQP